MRGGRAVFRRDAQQTSKHLGDMGAKNSAIGVELVDNDQVEAFEQGFPLPVPRQNARVEHVGGGDQDRRRVLPDPSTFSGRGVAIVDPNHGFRVETAGVRIGLKAIALVAFEGAEGKEAEGVARLTLGEALHDGQAVHKGLATRGRGREDDVFFPHPEPRERASGASRASRSPESGRRLEGPNSVRAKAPFRRSARIGFRDAATLRAGDRRLFAVGGRSRPGTKRSAGARGDRVQ